MYTKRKFACYVFLFCFFKEVSKKNKPSASRNIPNTEVLKGTLTEWKEYYARIRKDIFAI